MANGGNNSSNTAIVALIVVGLLIAGGTFLYVQGGFGGRDVVQHETTIIEKQAPAPAPKVEDESGFKIEHQDADGDKTEIQAP